MTPTVLFVCDFQALIRTYVDTAWFDAAAFAAGDVLARARELGPEKVKIIHVMAGGAVRKDHSQYSVRKDSGLAKFMETFPATVDTPGIVDNVAPLPDEQILARPRASIFHDTPLNAQLRALGATKLIFCGVATSGVVLSSARSAVDADYEVFVVGEACADISRSLHDELVKWWEGPWEGAKLMSVEEAKAALEGVGA
ncbi:Isochorismatase hydrolase [Calocera cornea HHB12733]|uniref:Isochorismatase hydrolase n=1 Tax=Calocera cornea HHB12733 TaxID=1353952 RepID=A0A165ESM2_9BASI|nr:Isochorismatase hydrolase [Calocera cornea HHB12733]